MGKSIKISKELDEASRKRVDALANLKSGAHIHISGICGTGTAAVLSLLKQLGFFVSGSDKAFYPPMGDVVRDLADRVYEGYSADNFEMDPDLVVIGNALSRDNPEVQAVLEKSYPIASMPEVFAALLIRERDYCPNSIVICGTHGKTTTTAAIATVLEKDNRKPGYFIGGVPLGLDGGIRPVNIGVPLKKRAVVLEGDEYDSAFFAKYSKFHSYRPDIAVVTSLEFDHADIFNSIADIEREFTRFAERLPAEGVILVSDTGERLSNLAQAWTESDSVLAQVLRYGESDESDYQILSREQWKFQDIPERKFGQEIEMRLGSSETIKVQTMLSGKYNAYNLLAMAAVAQHVDVSEKSIKAAARDFSGVARRQQVIYQHNQLLVMEDFAHHPTAVKAALDGLRESYPDKRLLSVFEPRSNTSRRSFFQEAYARSFSSADFAVILDVADAGGYSGTDAEVVPLDVDRLCKEVIKRGTEAMYFSTVDEICEFLEDELGPGDLVVLMSNGDFGGLPLKLTAALKELE